MKALSPREREIDNLTNCRSAGQSTAWSSQGVPGTALRRFWNGRICGVRNEKKTGKRVGYGLE